VLFRVFARRLAAAAVIIVLSLVIAPPARAQWQKNEYQLQKEWSQQFLPAPILAPKREGGRGPGPVRIRFHADADFRSEGGRWQENIKVLLGNLNKVVGQSFGVRFEVAEFRRWDRTGANGELGPMLEQLEKLDPGLDVDWVVGLVSSLPLVSMSFHDLGKARVLGRHFVVRGMNSVAEMQDFQRMFKAMEQSERDQLYGIRKAHKETSVFLHEWAHTLGAPHVEDPTRIMNVGYSQRTSLFSNEDAELMSGAVDSRLRSRGRETDAIDWSPLHRYLKDNRNTEYRQEDWKYLVDLTAPRTGVAPGSDRAAGPADLPVPVPPPFGLRPRPAPPPPPPPPAERPANAPAASAGGGATAPGAAASGAAAARKPGRTPEPPFANEARSLLRSGQRTRALALLERTAGEVATRVPADSEAQAAIARVYAEAGAVTAADRTLARAGDAPAIRQAAAEVLRARRRMGLPKSVARFQLPPSAEPDYADTWDRLRSAMNSGDLKSAKAAVDTGLRKFPGAPGLITADCEVLLRQDRPDQAAKRCQEALAVMEDLPRAHYLIGCIQAEAGQHEPGVTSLKRAIALDPRNRAAWESLGDLMRALGRSKEYQKFLVQHGGPTDGN
jgi:tetratricopeptide (TPR) repeat protein